MVRESWGCAACTSCLRRSWLLGELGAVLDYNCRADGRLIELLALPDEMLIDAIGGRRRAELQRAWASFQPRALARATGVEAICRHDRRYPLGLRRVDVPPVLHVHGGLEQLHALAARPLVALVGTRRASDYGIELARGLGRGLGTSGVTVVTVSGGGIAQAARLGALDGGGVTITARGDGLPASASVPACRSDARLHGTGCTISELPCDVRGRRWGAAASERIVAALAALTVVVEAEDEPRALACARLAQGFGRKVVAVPGRVTSRSSRGSHLLLRAGAGLIRDAADVLDALYGLEGSARADDDPTVRGPAVRPSATALQPRLLAVLEQVSAGVDTPGRLTAEAVDPGAVLLALSELELRGLLVRGDGGRYLTRGLPG